VKSLHITQAITQPKIAKNAQITQKNTSFKAHFLTFWGPNDWFLNDFRKKNDLLVRFQLMRNEKLSHVWPDFLEFFRFLNQVHEVSFWFLWVENEVRFSDRQEKT